MEGVDAWVVGKYIEETNSGAVWELQGVFTRESKATGRGHIIR